VPAVLKASRLRRIIAAYTVNRLGTWFGLIALSLAVFDHTHSALAVAGLLVAGQVLPAFVVPALVARVEASRRGRELSGLYIFEAVVTVALAVLLWHFSLPAVLVLVALDGTAALAASALLRTETARAARDELGGEGAADGGGSAEERVQAAERRANAALNVAFSATFVLGPALAGAIVAAGGAPLALFIDAGSFLICGAMLLDLHPHVEDAADGSVRSRLRAAWRHINEVPALRALLITQAVAMVFFESAAPIEVAYAKVTLAAGDSGFGFLVGTWGAGVVLGSIIFARSSSRPLGVMLTAGTLAVGAGYVGFAAAPTLLAACPAALLGGIGNGVQWAPMISAVQRLTPQALLGRVMSAVESMGALCPAVGLLLGGALVALSSPRVAFSVVGVSAMLTTLAFMRIHVDRAAPAAAAESDLARAGTLADPDLPARTGTIEPAPH
jgi:MFS family permease